MLVMNRTCKGMEMNKSGPAVDLSKATYQPFAVEYVRAIEQQRADLVAALQQIEKLLACEQPLEMIQRAFVRSGFARVALAKAEGQS